MYKKRYLITNYIGSQNAFLKVKDLSHGLSYRSVSVLINISYNESGGESSRNGSDNRKWFVVAQIGQLTACHAPKRPRQGPNQLEVAYLFKFSGIIMFFSLPIRPPLRRFALLAWFSVVLTFFSRRCVPCNEYIKQRGPHSRTHPCTALPVYTQIWKYIYTYTAADADTATVIHRSAEHMGGPTNRPLLVRFQLPAESDAQPRDFWISIS